MYGFCFTNYEKDNVEKNPTKINRFNLMKKDKRIFVDSILF